MGGQGNNTVRKNPKGKCLGLIGGLGVGAAVYYYQELARAHEARGIPLQFLLVHADMHRVFRHVQAGDPVHLAQYLAELIGRLQAGGADISAVAAVAPHLCVHELIAISPLPLVSLLEPLREEIRASGFRRVALFGTRSTMETGLFGELKDVELLTPKPDEVEYVHNVYLQLALNGRGTEEQHRGLTTLAHTLCERDGADAIILAGTDLALLFNESNTDFPHIDCSRLHIRSIMSSLSG